MEEELHLGDKIVLSGFRDLDRSEMVVIRKMVGIFVKKFIELDQNFQKLKLHLKTTHEREQSVIYDLDLNYISTSNNYTANDNGRNLFMVLDSVLKKALNMIKKNNDK